MDTSPAATFERVALQAGDDLKIALAEVERLWNALHQYGEHDEDCKAVDHHELAVLGYLCDCGLLKALHDSVEFWRKYPGAKP
jgi:hypothetical protein